MSGARAINTIRSSPGCGAGRLFIPAIFLVDYLRPPSFQLFHYTTSTCRRQRMLFQKSLFPTLVLIATVHA